MLEIKTAVVENGAEIEQVDDKESGTEHRALRDAMVNGGRRRGGIDGLLVLFKLTAEHGERQWTRSAFLLVTSNQRQYSLIHTRSTPNDVCVSSDQTVWLFFFLFFWCVATYQ